MGKLCTATSCLLLIFGAASCNQEAHRQVSERVLPQWLTGIIAVVGFLFLAFVIFLVKKAWCEKSSGETALESGKQNESVPAYETCLELVRSKEDMNAYNNLVIDSTDDKVTAM
ncbi:PDZK1-interacting protein 1 [Echeneis naucrates]|uniref:PDZK1-interacting protein 1 n=1 Tax=Echeneis naucrates TaxID=173247 RepID=UPI00111390AB|nr:small integral membrane protein 24 [Echeneis naucrates]